MLIRLYTGFSTGSVVKNPPAVSQLKEPGVRSLGGDDLLEKATVTHSSILSFF